MTSVHLDDRGVIRVTGEDAVPWLQNIVTCDVAGLEPGGARYGALLTPQGKILFDFIVSKDPGGALFLDLPRDRVQDLAKRLGFYRLRAKVVIEDLSSPGAPGGGMTVVATMPGDTLPSQDILLHPDPRDPDLGSRAILPERDAPLAGGDLSRYHCRRLALAIPEGGVDFEYGDAFPHEALMDLLGGVDFRKGCYVGQEVVSRMRHRGTARTRIVPVTIAGPAPAPGTDVVAGGKALGRMGSSAGERGLALLRLDRVEDALAAGHDLTAGAARLELAAAKPRWWTAPWPGERAVGEA